MKLRSVVKCPPSATVMVAVPVPRPTIRSPGVVKAEPVPVTVSAPAIGGYICSAIDLAAGGDLQFTRFDIGNAGIGAAACQDGRARTGLVDHTGAGDGAAKGHSVRAIEIQLTIVGHIANNAARGATVAQLQRPGADGGARAV